MKRRVSLYCVLYSSGPLVVVKMPGAFVRWTVIRTALHAMLRKHYGVLAKNLHGVEGIAGSPDGDTDDGASLMRCEAAFSGSPDTLRGFDLHAWDDETKGFVFVRAMSSAPNKAG